MAARRRRRPATTVDLLAGTAVVVRGPSGAGKSTISRLLAESLGAALVATEPRWGKSKAEAAQEAGGRVGSLLGGRVIAVDDGGLRWYGDGPDLVVAARHDSVVVRR